jgi:putative transposase
MLSFNKPKIFKNTSKLRANTFGFYALNGVSVIDFKQNSKKESVCEFLTRIRDNNPKEKVVIILDRFSSHKAGDTIKCAERLGIRLVFLPPYSPDLNPIEYIWKSIKRDISCTFIYDVNHIKSLIATKFKELSPNLSFANKWITTFIECPLSIFG